MRKNWVILLVICSVLSLFMPQEVSAAPNTQIDAVLVMDASNSMNFTDPNRLGYEAIKMFIDMSLMTGDRIGFIAYTDKVERDIALLRIKNLQDKEDLKQQVADTKRGVYTDISIGLKAAVKNLDNYSDSSHKPLIVILADGNNELDDKSTKTLAECDDDVAAAIVDAQNKGYVVYTIGLNANGKLNGDYLKNISNETGGKFFETNSADDLPGILSEILADHLELKLANTDVISDGDFQEVYIPIRDNNVLEANITLMSQNPVELALYDPSGNEIAIPSNSVIKSTSNTYSMIKMISPHKGDWLLKVRGVSGDKIKISLLYNYDLSLQMEPLALMVYNKGDTVNFKAHLFQGTDKITDTDLYNAITCELIVDDLTTGKQETIQGINTGDSFEAAYTINEEHSYEAYLKISHSNFFKETDKVNFEATAVPQTQQPTVTPKPTQNNSQVIQTEEAEATESKSSMLSLFLIIAAVAAALVALIAMLLFVLKRNNKKMEGRFVIEVLDKSNGDLTPTMYKNLNMYGRRTNLFELLDSKMEYRNAKDIIITTNPSANSANPEVFIKNTGIACKVKRGSEIVDCGKKNGITIGLKTKLNVILESQNKEISITYRE